MTENKRYIEFLTKNSDDGKLNHGFKDIVKEEWYYTKDERTAKKCVDLLNEQDTEIQRLKLIINGLNYALKNIRQIDVEIDLNECGDVMNENKRYTTDNGSNEDVCLVDNVTGKEFESDFDEIVDLLNEQEAEIKRLEDELQNLQTFKKILEFAEKDMEERADWQAYCEKEFEGL